LSWKNHIPGCFGAVDKKFALHPRDATCAAELLVRANKEGIGFEEFCREIKAWLITEGCGDEHVACQMESVKDIKSYFTYD